MKLLVKGKNVAVTDRLESYAEKRLSKVSRHIDDEVTRLELEVSEVRNPRVSDKHVAEATIWTKGATIRATDASPDIFASVDMVADKLLRQVRKYREKRIQSSHGGRHRTAKPHSPEAIEQAHANGSGNGNGNGGVATTTRQETATMADGTPTIVKTKQFQMGPMTPDEAALQLDLVGHDFFVFVNSENDQTSVIYRRNDGDLGLIEPTLTELEAS